MALFYLFWRLIASISLDRNHIFEICKLILLVPHDVSLSLKGFSRIQFQSKDIKHQGPNLRCWDMSCLNLETECQAQIRHQTAPLEQQLWSISKAKRIFSPIGPKGDSIWLLRGRQKRPNLASFWLRHPHWD